MNKVILIGRLCNEPTLKFLPGNGIAVTTFTLAVNRNFKNKDGQIEADFINIVAYRKLAEVIANNLTKGRQIAVAGRLQTRTYEDKQGQKKTWTEVVIDEMQFIDKKESDNKPTTNQQTDNLDEDFFPLDGSDDIPF